MASGFTMVPTKDEHKEVKVAKNKSSTKKSAGAQAIQAGGSGKMHKFSGAKQQQPGGTANTNTTGLNGKFAAAGPSGKMQKFTGVKPQRPGGTAVTNSGRGSYAK